MSNFFLLLFLLKGQKLCLLSDPAGVDLNLQSWLSGQTSEKKEEYGGGWKEGLVGGIGGGRLAT